MNLSPIGTAYKASQAKSFDGIGTAAQDGMGAFMDMFGQVADKRKAQVDNEVKKGLVNLMAAMQHRKALEPPKPTPVIQKQDMAPMGIALLLALLTKQKSQDIAQFGEGFMGARQMGAQNQDRYNQQVWQTQNENAQQDQRMEFERAKLGYGEAVDERNRLDTFSRENRQRADEIADDARTFDREQLKQGQLTEREKMRITGRRSSTEYQSQMNVIRDGLKQAYNLSDPAQKMEAISRLNRMVATGEMEGFMRDDLARELSGNTFQQDSLKAKTEGQRLANEYLSRTLNDRVDIMASKKGIDDTKLAIIKKDLQYYEEDRALKVAQARARIAASNRSNQQGAGGQGAPLSPTEERLRAKAVISSTKELMDFAYDELLQKVPVMRDGRKLTGPELIERASVMARNGDPIVGPLFEHYQSNKAEYQRLVERASAGSNAPIDLGMGTGPLSGAIGGSMGGLDVRPETQRTQPRTKKTTPAKKKTVTRGNWKIEIER